MGGKKKIKNYQETKLLEKKKTTKKKKKNNYLWTQWSDQQASCRITTESDSQKNRPIDASILHVSQKKLAERNSNHDLAIPAGRPFLKRVFWKFCEIHRYLNKEKNMNNSKYIYSNISIYILYTVYNCVIIQYMIRYVADVATWVALGGVIMANSESECSIHSKWNKQPCGFLSSE